MTPRVKVDPLKRESGPGIEQGEAVAHKRARYQPPRVRSERILVSNLFGTNPACPETDPEYPDC